MSEGRLRGAIAAGLAGPETAPTDRVQSAMSVYTPLSALPTGEEVLCELRTLTDGHLGLLVYASVAELVACCGTAQPWAEIPSARLEELREATGADVVLSGAELPPAARRDGADRPATAATMTGGDP